MEVKGKGCTVKVIAHSRAEHCPDLYTLQLRYWRGIHSEFMTHRVFSRNASSSRAIPVKRMLEQVRNDPAMPVRFGGNKPGMQDTGAEHDGVVMLTDDGADFPHSACEAWQVAAKQAAHIAEAMMEAGYHKQVCNRLIEPFQYISVVVTATEWDNFFALRDHDAADPTIHDLAHTMRAAMEMSIEPRELKPGHESSSWHLPYVREEERTVWPLSGLQRLSVARCARVSYNNHDGSTAEPSADFGLCNQLLKSGHMSPFEHQASPGPTGLHSNLKDWRQLRKLVESHPKYLGEH